MLLNDYKNLSLERQARDHEKNTMPSALQATISCSLEGQKIKAENKNLTFVNAELITNSKTVPFKTTNSRHEKIVNSVLRHSLGHARENELKIPS